MHPGITTLEKNHRKSAVAQVQSGDTVRVHQRIKEGAKERVQVFEGVVIRTHRAGSLTACITVRRIASGIGVEKTFLLHSPNVAKVEVMRRAKVRRNFLSYLRARRGKSARLQELAFDKAAANVTPQVKAEDEVQEEIDEIADAEVTEINEEATEQVQPDVSTEELANNEDKDAAQADTDSSSPDDEQKLAADEHQSGVKRADDEAKQ